MNTKADQTFSTIKNLILLHNENLATIDAHKQLKQEFDELDNDRQNLDQLIKIADQPIKSYTKEKATAKQYYIEKLRYVLGLTCLLAKTNGDEKFIAFSDYSESDLKKLKPNLLIAKSGEIVDYFNANPTIAEDAGLTPEDIQTMTSAAQSYQSTVTKANGERAKHQKDTQKCYSYAQKVSKRIFRKIEPAMKAVFQKRNPDIWTQFQNIVHPKNVVVKHYDVIGKIIDAQTEEGIYGATIEIEKLELKKHVRSKNGKFFIPEVEEGRYWAKCSQPNYFPAEIEFRKVVDKVSYITIIMQPDPVAKQNAETSGKLIRKTKSKTRIQSETPAPSTIRTETTEQQMPQNVEQTATENEAQPAASNPEATQPQPSLPEA